MRSFLAMPQCHRAVMGIISKDYPLALHCSHQAYVMLWCTCLVAQTQAKKCHNPYQSHSKTSLSCSDWGNEVNSSRSPENCSLRAGGLWNARGTMKGHCRILKEASGKIPLLDAKMDFISVKYNFTRPYRFELEGCEEKKLKPDINIFMNGSKSSHGTGSRIFSEKLNLRQNILLVIN